MVRRVLCAEYYSKVRLLVVDLLGSDGVLLVPGAPRSSYYHNEPLFCPFDNAYASLWNTLGLPTLTAPMVSCEGFESVKDVTLPAGSQRQRHSNRHSSGRRRRLGAATGHNRT